MAVFQIKFAAWLREKQHFLFTSFMFTSKTVVSLENLGIPDLSPEVPLPKFGIFTSRICALKFPATLRIKFFP